MNPECRSRLVAKDIKINKNEDLFAATPPLEAKKALFRIGARKMAGHNTIRARKMKLLFIDVRKAHLNAHCDKTDVFVELPEEASSSPGKCGKLNRWLYGMRGLWFMATISHS